MSTLTSATRNRLRYLLAIVGVGIFVVGLLMAAAPNAAGASLRAVVAVLGADYWLVAIVGILAFLLLVAILLPKLRRVSSKRPRLPPSASIPSPGSANRSTTSPTPVGSGSRSGTTATTRSEHVFARLPSRP